MNVGRQYTDQKHNACLHVCMYACFIIIETLEKMNELEKKKIEREKNSRKIFNGETIQFNMKNC